MSLASSKIASSEERTLRVSTPQGEPVALSIDASDAVAVRLEIDSNCGCAHSTVRGVGSYTDTDFGKR